MKTPALMLLVATLLCGCVTAPHGALYPLQGPLATRNPLPVLPMSFSSTLVVGATVRVTLDTGEVCKGAVAMFAKDDPTANSMAAQWDTIYGQGYFVANVLGNHSLGGGVLKSASGTTITLEFYETRRMDVRSSTGVAQDNRGNLYKVTF